MYSCLIGSLKKSNLLFIPVEVREPRRLILSTDISVIPYLSYFIL
nr:MAG TPA: hypothetical protein [Caudoviricetes sp.]